MKPLIKTAAFAFVVFSITLTSCIKKTENPVVYPKTVFAKWNGVFRNCDLAKKGTCTSLAEPLNDNLENINLDINEGAGTVTTKKLSNGNALTTISLTRLNLSQSLKSSMLGDKEILTDGETLIPVNLMNASFAAAGLTDKISEPVVIPQGIMPLTIEQQGLQNISNITIELTTSGSKHDYVGHVTLLR